MKNKTLFVVALMALATSVFAQRGPGHRRPAPHRPVVVRPIPRPLPPMHRQCSLQRIQRVSQRLVAQSRQLTQESRRILGRSQVTRSARQLTQEAQYFSGLALSSVRCRRVKREFQTLAQNFRQLRRAIDQVAVRHNDFDFGWDVRRGGLGHGRGGLGHGRGGMGRHRRPGLRLLKQDFAQLRQVFARLRMLVNQGQVIRHY